VLLASSNGCGRQLPKAQPIVAAPKKRPNARDEGTPETSSRILVSISERVDASRRFSVVHCGRKILIDHILACLCQEVGIRPVGRRAPMVQETGGR
jgi:hypothetical protein